MVDTRNSTKTDHSTHRSLGRGLGILETVAGLGDGASLADVAQRMNLARSTTHYLMQARISSPAIVRPELPVGAESLSAGRTFAKQRTDNGHRYARSERVVPSDQ